MEKIKENEYMSILLVGNTLNYLKNLIEIILKTIKILKSVIKFPYIVPGGGSIEIYNTIIIMKKKKFKEVLF